MSHDAHHRYEWNTLPWRKLEVKVFKLQRRIYQATTRGETKKAHRLQRLLATSWSAKSLAVRRVTQENKGKKTAGVDGKSHLTPPQRLKLISIMDLHAPAKPVRRVWIPKPGTPEKRPLGIPVMHDRGTQALAKLALEPEWEAQFEPNSFGFRPGRSCQDAIRHIYNVINLRPSYVLDADIASCFDKIDQAALLEKMATSPFFARPIKEWLKAGVVDHAIFKPIHEGTPQGGVISPLLANIALHGMEEVARRAGGPEFPCFNGKQIHQRTTCIRYADDFVILHRTWEGIQRCKDAIQEWLKGMGLELKDAKTRFAHTFEAKEECHGNVGFDFLGFTIRQYPVGKYVSRKQYVTIIKPSKKSIERHYAALAALIERRRAATIDEVIRTLNPTIIGWGNYVKTQVSKKAFQRLDDLLWHKMYQWAKRKHNTKTAAWILEKYFKPEGTRKHHKIMGKTHILSWHDNTRIKRHIPLRVAASPYDGNWSYWGTRKGAYIGLDTTRGKLLKHQGGRCGYCRLFFTVEDKTEIHHEDGNHKNHRFSNLKLLHLICHDQVHGTKKYTHEHIHGKTYSRQERITEEPCAGKLASTVLETSQEG
jgi:RNA-directed DNA polymerase